MAPKNTPPLGFRFRPTDHEVFTLLGKLVNKGQLPSYYPIVERTLFGDKPPWYVLNDDDPWEQITPEGNNNDSTEKKILYVFTKLVSLGKSRAVRSSACGTWDGKSALNKIKNKNGVVIGHKKYYTFKPKNNGLEETKSYGKWMMHEYSFPNDKSGFVLCKITVDGGTRDSADDGLCGKRKLSVISLDDDCGSRKVCKGSGSSSGQEIVLKELDECRQVYDVSCSLAGSSSHDQTLQDPSIKTGQEVLIYSAGMQGQQINQVYNGLENSASAANYDHSFPIIQQPESQEILAIGTHDDIVKESHSVTSVGYSMAPTWCAGSSSSSTSIDQLRGRREETVTPDDGCIPEMYRGSESETGQISVTTELGEIGPANDDFDLWSCIDLDDDLTFQVPSDMDEREISSSGGMQAFLFDDNYGLDEILYETRSNLDEAVNQFLLH